MASNEYVIPEHYEDLTPAPQLDQKTLNKMAWRSCFLQASFNYERMQAAGWLYSIIPGLTLAGNIKGGIGMADRIRQATEIADKLING